MHLGFFHPSLGRGHLNVFHCLPNRPFSSPLQRAREPFHGGCDLRQKRTGSQAHSFLLHVPFGIDTAASTIFIAKPVPQETLP